MKMPNFCMNLIRRCWYKARQLPLKVLNLCQRFIACYKTEWVEDLPDNPEKNTIYIVGGHEHPYYATLPCPRKNCKRIIPLEIAQDFETRWRFKEHEDGTLTLQPSIYVTKYPCKCHYQIRKGHVEWCEIPRIFVPKKNLI